MTHEEYLDEPSHTVDWLLEIAALHKELEAEQQKRAEANAR